MKVPKTVQTLGTTKLRLYLSATTVIEENHKQNKKKTLHSILHAHKFCRLVPTTESRAP